MKKPYRCHFGISNLLRVAQTNGLKIPRRQFRRESPARLAVLIIQYAASIAVLLLWLICAANAQADWPQASGPNSNFVISGHAAREFSVTRQQNILWRSPLPNTGESTPIVSGDRIFLTCHAPMTKDADLGDVILGLCFDATTGRELWRRELPAARRTDMASGFSDNTAASPVTDGQRVCFVNVGGSIRTFDFVGNLLWKHDWVPFGRHHARQHEPFIVGNRVVLVKTMAEDLPVSATTKSGAKPLGRDMKYWTRLQALDMATGETVWVADCGTSVHSTSMLGQLRDGTPAILTGRGGGHQPPEEPYGLSLLDATDGTSIWQSDLNGYAAHQNAVWRADGAHCFIGKTHQTLNIATGQVQRRIALDENVLVCRHDGTDYVTNVMDSLGANRKNKAITYHTNCLVGDFHYFRAHNDFLIGRIHVRTDKVEYLQVPVQVVREPGSVDDIRWNKALPNDVKNVDGYVVCQDKRATSHGWGHVSAASPIVVGERMYVPTMLGIVYVLDWNVDSLNEKAIVSISDLGPAQRTWTLSSLAFSDGRLYARTLKELICIAPPH